MLNRGPEGAALATLTVHLPAGASLESAQTTRGAWDPGPPVVCSLGALESRRTPAAGDAAVVSLRVVAGQAGTYTASAALTGDVEDPDPGNNQAVAEVVVPAGWIMFLLPHTAVGEGAGQATIRVALGNVPAGGPAADVAVRWTAGDGTAPAGRDYLPATGVLAWARGDAAEKTSAVSILDEQEAESDEEVALTLSEPTGGPTLGPHGSAVLVILDDDRGEGRLEVLGSGGGGGGCFLDVLDRPGRAVGLPVLPWNSPAPSAILPGAPELPSRARPAPRFP